MLLRIFYWLYRKFSWLYRCADCRYRKFFAAENIKDIKIFRAKKFGFNISGNYSGCSRQQVNVWHCGVRCFFNTNLSNLTNRAGQNLQVGGNSIRVSFNSNLSNYTNRAGQNRQGGCNSIRVSFNTNRNYSGRCLLARDSSRCAPQGRVFKILIIFMSKLSQKWMSN